ncbi:zinc finger protein 484 [Bombyx mori]|uniref:Uncharacterized protein n=2 Tax=Bombyx mori TaxID=7091 RepID=A0A8R2MB11_BOMMO|nr:zinc finger protein 484-like [Bombyx mori]
MDTICRLCCSDKFVNNYIFDEKNAWYLKMALLPVKIDKNDRLPQKICDHCSRKVNEFYEFCNETIVVENKLQAFLKQQGTHNTTVDLILGKPKTPILPPKTCEQSHRIDEGIPVDEVVKIKVETPKEIKQEDIEAEENYHYSDDSDDVYLTNLKAKKNDIDVIRLKNREKQDVKSNGVKKNSCGNKSELMEDWSILLKQFPEGPYNLVDETDVPVKQEVKDENSADFDDLPNLKDKYRCCICLKNCKFKSTLLKHYKTHGKDIPKTNNLQVPPIPDQNPLKCTRCRKSVKKDTWAEHWQNHWKRDHRPYRCALCDKSFTSSQQVMVHGLSHSHNPVDDEAMQLKKQNRYVCDFCPEEFMYMRCLQAHRTNAHPESASKAVTHRCWKCSRQFAHLNSLRRHFMTHTGERNFLCNVCGKAMSSRDHLKLHINIHTGYKPNVCSTCGKGFVKKSNLKLHERVHSGEKPYVCSHCGKAFSQRSTLVIHERYHNGVRPYVCALCGRGFVAKGLLSVHLKNTCI